MDFSVVVFFLLFEHATHDITTETPSPTYPLCVCVCVCVCVQKDGSLCNNFLPLSSGHMWFLFVC